MIRHGRLSFVRDLVRFVFSGRRLWLLPIFLVLLVISIMAATGALAPYSMFLYPL
jgi:Family of unknown function (DUF5989)